MSNASATRKVLQLQLEFCASLTKIPLLIFQSDPVLYVLVSVGSLRMA